MSTFTVGNGQQFSTIASAVAAAQPGDTVQIQAGTYTNDFPGYINGLTIEGVGGQVNLVATEAPPNGKAYLDEGGNTTISGLTISGVTDGSGNGAAIRYEGGSLTLSNDTLTGNQDGLLGAADPNGTISITSSTISGNGTSAGNAHDIYVGNIDQFSITGSTIADADTGHEIKSRAANNTITGDTISDQNSNASYEIDLPNGGSATIDNDTITKGAASGNNFMIAYGEEGASNPGNTVDLSGDTFDASAYTAHIPHVLYDPNGATVTGSGNTLVGIDPSQAGVPASLFSAVSSSADTLTTSLLTS